MDPEALLARARAAKENAWAPYSGFCVGAALLSEDGSVHVGSNVENASYGLTMCAERVAVGSAVAAGRHRFRAVALSTDGPTPVPPCGACRQVLAEFGPDMTVISEAGGATTTWRMQDLLPEPFLSGDLDGAGRGGKPSAGGSLPGAAASEPEEGHER